VVLGVHLLLVQKKGMSVPVAVENEAREKGTVVRSMPFVPNFALRDLFGWLVALAILAALAALWPWELLPKADPFGVPAANIRPEWFFLWMFQSLKKIPRRSSASRESSSGSSVSGSSDSSGSSCPS